MNAITAPLRELAEFEEGQALLKKQGACIGFTGCVDSQKLHMAYGLSDGFRYKIIVTFSDLKAREIFEDYQFYDRDVTWYPAKDLIFYQADIHGNQLVTERMKALRKIMEGKPLTVITTFAALMSPQVPLEEIAASVIHIDADSSLDESGLARKLSEMGYEKNYQVDAPGQFSIRGGIIDIFDLTEENPYRIELWGEEVESIRSFDLLSQRSVEKLDEVDIYPATEMMLSAAQKENGLRLIEKEAKEFGDKLQASFLTEEAHRVRTQVKELREQVLEFSQITNLESYIRYFYEDTVSFLRFFPAGESCIFIDEALRVKEHALAVEMEFRESMGHRLEKGYILPRQADLLYGWEVTAGFLQNGRTVLLSSMDSKNALLKPQRKFDVNVKSMSSYNSSFDALVSDLKRYKKNGYRVLLLSGSRTRARRLAEDLQEQGLNSFYSEDGEREVIPGEVMLFYGHVKRGFEYPLLKFVVITESDIFGAQKKKKKHKKKFEGQKINDFSELRIGDYVVHESHGLGIYQGIEKVEVERIVKDYIKISYRDGGNLYVLATGLDVIQKYASSDAAKTPKLNKLGTQEWHRTKTKVRSAVDEVAKDLVELYAVRQQQEGYPYSRDTVWQKEFEECFPFEETDDQLAAIAATKEDMESYRIMDRLICGDVGYGKTEIAIRAAFKAIQDGKQVAFLVPTTILAQQHYNTFVQRMKDFPVRVDMLSRFCTPARQKRTLEDLRKGMVDIVIGTHRVLSKDMQFKDLGLLIIDEEQRFGVAHKEKIKHLKENVDVLTLTATPIPRTLHMSLAGIRDMSVLEEPPVDRTPIQTYVMEYNEEMVREAINRELARNGQVYYVYNRVTDIDEVAGRVQALVPDAVVTFAHGQMREHELERIMADFINGEIDVLVSTTIIETGLDIPNANTMIIHDADRMGLSQLYQLRGRVGRSNRTSYAFLMYKRDKLLREEAEKRLQAIREFTELGSGIKIAMRDLEIRGAGNVLGAEQHGHMEAVGYDLYCKMLNQAVLALKGETLEEDSYDTVVECDIDAYIPGRYIKNEYQKLDIYKRISAIETEEEYMDMQDELMDRFGDIPRSVENLLKIASIRALAHQAYVTEVVINRQEVRLTMYQKAKLQVEKIPDMVRSYKGDLKLVPGDVPSFHYIDRRNKNQDSLEMMEKAEEILKSMCGIRI